MVDRKKKTHCVLSVCRHEVYRVFICRCLGGRRKYMTSQCSFLELEVHFSVLLVNSVESN